MTGDQREIAGEVGRQEEQVKELLNSLKTKTVTESIRVLIAAFANPTWIVRKRASEALVKIADRAVPDLKKALSDSNEDVQYWAVRTLGILGAAGVDPLLEVVKDSTYRIQMSAVEALGKNGDPRAVAALIEALASSSWEVCNAASNALATTGKAALKPLGQSLRQQDETRRYWATITLGRMGKPAVPALVRFARAKNKGVRFSAARAMGETCDEKCIKPLITLLGDEYLSIRKAAAESLVALGDAAVPPLLEIIKSGADGERKWASRVLSRIGPGVIKSLLVLLREDREEIFERVAWVIETIGESGAGTLVELMRDRDPNVRAMAAQFAAGLDSPRVLLSLIERLDDTSWPVRRNAAESLVSFGDTSLKYLTRAIETGNTNIRYWTTKILSRLGGEALDPLIRALSDEKEDIRMFAAWALGEAGEEKGVPALIGALRDKSWNVRKNVAEALKKLKLISVSHLIKALNHPNPDVQYWVSRVIEEIGTVAVEPLINVLLNNQDKEMRFFAAYALSAIPDPRAVEPLSTALEGDVNEWVRKYAATGLGCIGTDEAVEILLENLGSQREDVEEWVIDVVAGLSHPSLQGKLISRFTTADREQVASIARVLGARGEESAIPYLIKFMGSEDELLVAASSHALSEIGLATVPHLISALGSENWSVRSESARVLSQFGAQARELLEAAADSSNKNVSYWASHALRQIK